jgi:3',5'-cyclic AMP phosphodiesterase CpdA
MRRFVDANAKLETAVAYLNGLDLRPDVVVATGDLTDNGRADEYGLLTDIVRELDVPLLLLPGNHDEREPFRAMARANGHDYVPETGFINYAIDDWAVRIVVLDSIHDDHHDGEVDAERLAWLDRTLAARPDTPTMVCLHHVPFRTGIWWMDCIWLTGAAELRAVIERHPQVVRVIAGHLHRPIQTNWGATIVSCAPSTTHQTRCNLRPDHEPVLTDEPPMLQLHWWNEGAFVSHTTPFEKPEHEVNLATQMNNWETTRGRIRQGPPFAKGGTFG